MQSYCHGLFRPAIGHSGLSDVTLEMKSWVDLEMKIKIRVCSILPATYLLKNLCMVRNSSVSLCDAQCEDYPHFIQVWIPPSIHPSSVCSLSVACTREERRLRRPSTRHVNVKIDQVSSAVSQLNFARSFNRLAILSSSSPSLSANGDFFLSLQE